VFGRENAGMAAEFVEPAGDTPIALERLEPVHIRHLTGLVEERELLHS
jgi:hypothetical protein